MSKVLITGASGFVGKYLADEIKSRDTDLQLVLWGQVDNPMLGSVGVDLRNRKLTAQMIKDVPPDYVFHLAGVTHVPTSFADPALTWETNLIGTLNIVESLVEIGSRAKLLFVSSAEVYGVPENLHPGEGINESYPRAPRNPYAASKAATEIMLQEQGRRGLNVAIARPFNHFGEGQSESFVLPSLAAQLREAINGNTREIKVGNLDAKRDFLYVTDVVRAYVSLMFEDKFEDCPIYNVCSGTSTSIRHLLDQMIELSNVDIDVTVDPNRVRPLDVPEFKGNADLIKARIGWKPEVTLKHGLSKLLGNYED